MASDLAGKFATAFNPVGSNPVNSTLLYKQGTPNFFEDLLNRSQAPGAPKTSFTPEEEEAFKLLSPEERGRAMLQRGTDVRQEKLIQDLIGANRQLTPAEALEADKERMRFAQEIGKESLGEGFKYSMLANIPKSIAQAYSGIAATNLYGGQAITDAMSKTLAAYPRPQFATVNFQPQKYFG